MNKGMEDKEAAGLTLVDSHCHLDFEAFDADRAEVIRRAQKLGVHQCIVPGVSPEQWPKAQALSGQFSGFFYAVGIHPWWLHNASVENLSAQLAPYLNDPCCVAVGECGLDKTTAADFSLQQAILIQHIEIAIDAQLPIIVHCVKAHNELLQLLKKLNYGQRGCGGVIHAFTGSYELATQYLPHGMKLGAGGSITYPRAKKTRDAFARLPSDAIVLETDAPDMPLNGQQGLRNSPESVLEVLKVLAELRSKPVLALAEIVFGNTYEVFRRLQRETKSIR